MSLYTQLQQRAADHKPIRVGLIGAGKFGSMYLAQVVRTPGVHLVAIADLNPTAAKKNLARVGWTAQQSAATSAQAALRDGKPGSPTTGKRWSNCREIDDRRRMHRLAGACGRHILAAIAEHKHVVNVTVEADAFCGPLLARRAAEAGVVYSLAYGDQPAMICDLVDWARTCGFPVVAAGRGHKWLPAYAQSTPDTVWQHWGLTPEQAERGGLNPKMFNSFLDGSKPSIEIDRGVKRDRPRSAERWAAVPAGERRRHPARHAAGERRRRAREERHGRSDLVAGARRPRDPVRHPHGRLGHVEAETDYIKHCFEEYKAHTDPSGRYFTLYKRWHLIGLEVGMSVASVALRREATGVAQGGTPMWWRLRSAIEARRDARRRRWLHGVGQAAAGGDVRRHRRAAAGVGA